jgi:hypothetical protein
MIEDRGLLGAVADEHPCPLVFATVSGAHLYGFPSHDSDFDLRGVHLMSRSDVRGLGDPSETVELSETREGREIDLVTHDAKKFFRLMLKRNGYVLEQLFSPIVVQTSTEHDELVELGRSCVTRRHVHHYLGFAKNQWDLFRKTSPARVKPLLYVYRVILTGIHLMRTGEVEANIVVLNDTAQPEYIPDLVERKVSGDEAQTLDDASLRFHEGEFMRLMALLERAGDTSTLPEEAAARAGLESLLIRLRLQHWRAADAD